MHCPPSKQYCLDGLAYALSTSDHCITTTSFNLKEINVKRKVWQLLAIVLMGMAFTACSDPDSESGNGYEISQSKSLVRDYSPVIGPDQAPVTIVEFFDPSCEACRAYYPYVKQIMAAFPDDVRLVMRYVLFHRGSQEAVIILEAARLQNLFVPVLESILEVQPEWHDDPTLRAAWQAAEKAGLDVEKAKGMSDNPSIAFTMQQDMVDAKAYELTGTPTFFVNGKRLTKVGPQALYDEVRLAVEATRE